MDGNSIPGLMKRLALVQFGLVVLVLVGCVAMPRPGGAVLLIPVFAGGAGAIPPGRIAVLRAGSIGGSLLVRIDPDVPFTTILRGGFLPLAAPGWLCADAPPSTRILEKAVLP